MSESPFPSAAEIGAQVSLLKASCRAASAKVTGDDMVREPTAARLLQLEPKTLRNDRSGMKRWPYVKRGRLVFYRLQDVARWMLENNLEG